MCAFFLVRIYPSALLSKCAFFSCAYVQMRFFPVTVITLHYTVITITKGALPFTWRLFLVFQLTSIGEGMTAIILAPSVPQASAISDREVSWEESALALISINVSWFGSGRAVPVIANRLNNWKSSVYHNMDTSSTGLNFPPLFWFHQHLFSVFHIHSSNHLLSCSDLDYFLTCVALWIFKSFK